MSDFTYSHVNPAGLRMAPSDIYVAFDTDEIGKQFGATIEHLQIAARRAAKKTRDSLMTVLLREQSAKTDIPQKALRLRYRKVTKSDRPGAWSKEFGQAILWIGVNPVEAQRVSKGRKLKHGYKVKQWMFDHAFKANIYGPTDKIWRRKGAELGPGRGASRFPVVKMTVEIDKATEGLIQKLEPWVARKFEENFEHELKYAMGWFE